MPTLQPRLITHLKAQGIAIVYISHKLDELFEIADRVTVLRDGYNISTYEIKDLDADRLITDMVGRTVAARYPHVEKQIGEEILRVEGLTKANQFQDISFSLKRGEILGISGLIGAGRTEIATAIFGLNHYDSGKIYLYGKECAIRSAKQAISHKIALVSEDRKLTGLNLISAVKNNITAAVDKRISTCTFIRRKKINDLSLKSVKELGIKVTSINQLTESLSGGNQQKIVLAKWLLTNPEIIILDEPTRGIDVGAKAEIYKLINEMTLQGKAVLMISSEMPEIVGMCDRVLVLNSGRLKGELNRDNLSQQHIMELISK